MIRNYLKIALRNLLKYKFISFINLFGLTVGLTCCLLIFTYILNELSYDRQHENADRIYRVTRSFRDPETGNISLNLGTVAPPFGPLLEHEFPEIQKTTRLLATGTTPLRYGEKIFNETDVYFADENLFDFFKIKMISGSARNALKDPYCVMLTEELAKKYFGEEEPLDKLIRFDSRFSFKVTGIYKPFPANSHLHPNILLSFPTLKDSAIYGENNLRTNWGNNSFFTYLLMPENFDPQKMEARFPAFLDRQTIDGDTKASRWTDLDLQKLTDIHLYSRLDYEAEENGDIKRVYIFSAIAIFILLIACINYTNLATARSTLRAKEIGLRKVVGAQRREIIFQFLSESVIVSWMAMLLALLLSRAFIPWLNTISGQVLSLEAVFQWKIIIPILLVPFIVGFFSGIYPAVFMSSFQPVKVLKGIFKLGSNKMSFRQVLVTAQFAISIVLIIATGVVFTQMRYMQQKSLGFDKEHVINLAYNSSLNDQYDFFRNELLSSAYLKNITRSSRIPTRRLLDANGASIQRGDTLAPANADIKYLAVDHDFITTYGIPLAAGRNFSRDFATDTTGFVINAAAASVLGFKSTDDVIGRNFGYGDRRGKIIGVVKNFHFESMHQPIVPMVFTVPLSPDSYGNLSIKITGSNIPAALAHIEKTWRKFLPEVPFQYTFMEENFENLYASEQRQKIIFTTFAGIAIFLACLGLFGLSAFAISQRIKEIGIRKVLGAGTGRIVTLLSKDFLKLVALAAVIAFPIAWYAMHSWLLDFAYRIDIPWWIFIMSGLTAALIAFATTAWLALKAAIANPARSLRSE